MDDAGREEGEGEVMGAWEGCSREGVPIGLVEDSTAQWVWVAWVGITVRPKYKTQKHRD
jgi:hypothetical protein